MGKIIRRLVGLVVTVAAGIAFWVAFNPASEAVAELEPPGSTTVHLEQGTYEVVVDTHVEGSGECDPADHFGDIRRLGLELESERGGIFTPQRRDSCVTSEHVGDGRDRAVSVSTFEVPESGDHELRVAKQVRPPATVTLVQAGEINVVLLVIGGVAAIVGITFLLGRKLGSGDSGEPFNHALHH